jgi:hypothetical protein
MHVRGISIKWFEVRGLWLGSLISRVQAVKANRAAPPVLRQIVVARLEIEQLQTTNYKQQTIFACYENFNGLPR